MAWSWGKAKMAIPQLHLQGQELHTTRNYLRGVHQGDARTVREPDCFSINKDEYTFSKFVSLTANLSLLFQVKIHIESNKVSHAYPVVGQRVTVHNPKKEGPTSVIFRPGVLREELKRVQR